MRLTFGRRDEDVADPTGAVTTAPVAPAVTVPAAATGAPPVAEPARPAHAAATGVPATDHATLAARLVVLMRGSLAQAGGLLESLLAGSAGPLPAALTHQVASVAEEMARMRKAIEDLDALVRLKPHDPGDVRLMIANDWLQRAVDLHGARADARGVRIELVAPEPDLLVRGVPDDLDAALFQLLDNAVNATRAGDTITIEAAADGQRLLVRVRDDGVGFDAQEADKLTGCFVRSRAAEAASLPGLGVGLFLADRIARQHGGAVMLRGEAGAGATAWLELPQA